MGRFVTGKVMPQYFADDFLFKDPDVSLTGIKEYCVGVRKIFDQSTARFDVITCGQSQMLGTLSKYVCSML